MASVKPDAPAFDALRAAVPHAERAAPSVSTWTVGQHVQHCCLSMIAIARGLEKSTPPSPPAPASLPRAIVFLLGRIPRGRARSPEAVVPGTGVTAAELLALIDRAAGEVGRVNDFDRGTWIPHPVLGPLRRDEALKFVRIHNRHHLRIVADILASRR